MIVRNGKNGQIIKLPIPRISTPVLNISAQNKMVPRTTAPIERETALSTAMLRKLRNVACRYICFQGENQVRSSTLTAKIRPIVFSRCRVTSSIQNQPRLYHQPSISSIAIQPLYRIPTVKSYPQAVLKNTIQTWLVCVPDAAILTIKL